ISDKKDNLTEHQNAVIEGLNSNLLETTKRLMDFKQNKYENPLLQMYICENAAIPYRKTGCPEKWIRFGSSCYFFSEESKFWDEARESCRARGADLVVINTEGENLFVSALKKQDVWIGLTDRVLEGTWKWVDGSPLTLFWGSDQPDDHNGEEDCGHIHDGFPGL
uniref:C-type lectin domain-containing protein n=1 Tax=Oryzias latipes TaxID=8090 RepID=A0A3P9L1F0_ORYLA